MRQLLPLALFATSAAVGCGSAPPREPPPTAPAAAAAPAPPVAPAVATPVTTAAPAPVVSDVPLAQRLHATAFAGPGNAVYSPASIALALAMAGDGARGQTAAEMAAVLGADAGARAQALLARLETEDRDGDGATDERDRASPRPVIAIANRLFADPSATLLPSYAELTRTRYRAAIEPTDFIGEADASRLKINGWVAERTHDKITDLLAPGTIDATTRLVLVNAIYLRAHWAEPFFRANTSAASFAVEGGGAIKVPTMRDVVKARWGDVDGARVLDLPYAATRQDPALAMLIGLGPLLAALGKHRHVDVSLPRFTIRTSQELSGALGKLGMPSALSSEADFSGISSAPLQISRVDHQAWIKVDEVGTEAAAATGVRIAVGAAGPDPHRFKVDRSFLAFVHDEAGEVLFAARVVDPR
jgi:serpin B